MNEDLAHRLIKAIDAGKICSGSRDFHHVFRSPKTFWKYLAYVRSRGTVIRTNIGHGGRGRLSDVPWKVLRRGPYRRERK